VKAAHQLLPDGNTFALKVQTVSQQAEIREVCCCAQPEAAIFE
jgi:hypothetical protein